MAAECQCFGYSYADGNSIRHVGTMAYFSAFNEPVAINGDNRTGSAGHFVLCRRVPVHPETHHRRKGARRERPELGSCPTDATREGRSRRAVRKVAAMPTPERLHQQSSRHSGPVVPYKSSVPDLQFTFSDWVRLLSRLIKWEP